VLLSNSDFKELDFAGEGFAESAFVGWCDVGEVIIDWEPPLFSVLGGGLLEEGGPPVGVAEISTSSGLLPLFFFLF